MALTRIFDAHFHIIDPGHRLIENEGYLPDPFGVEAYRAATADLPVVGGAVVSGSFQGFDVNYLHDALPQLGAGFVGVVNLTPTVTREQLERMHAHGIRAVRFNLYRGSSDLDDVQHLATLAHDTVGWHSEFYLDAKDLPSLALTLERLPQITIDHFGMSDDPTTALLDLVRHGAIVKASGLGRIAINDTGALARRILDTNPHGLMFGTDLPSTRARVPYSHADISRIAKWVGPDHLDDVFYNTAAGLYGR